MSSAALRTSMRMASRPHQRLASIQRHFSASAQQHKEVRDAYILSASRTPTAVVRVLLP
jgi:acetyl-CoA C-acetyltransferase